MCVRVFMQPCAYIIACAYVCGVCARACVCMLERVYTSTADADAARRRCRRTNTVTAATAAAVVVVVAAVVVLFVCSFYTA